MQCNEIGKKIRMVREKAGLSIEALSERSQCSALLISKIEAGDLVPSLTPLLRIARGLGVRLGTFLDDAPHNEPVLVRAGRSPRVVHFSDTSAPHGTGTLDFFSLASNKLDRHMEPFLIQVHPPAKEQHHLSSHEGEEFLFVLSGAIEVVYGNERYELGQGDSLYYDSVVPHSVHAAHQQEATILAVVYAPA